MSRSNLRRSRQSRLPYVPAPLKGMSGSGFGWVLVLPNRDGNGVGQILRLMDPVQSFEFEGCKFAYRVEGAGPPLIMIQGVGAHGVAYNPQVEILKSQYTCVTFDNRGIGASQPVGKELTVKQMARDSLALLDHLGWTSAHVVGHSLGGLISLELALLAKPRVRSLTLLNTFANGADARRFNLRIIWIGLRLRFGTRKIRRKAFLELVMAQGEEKAAADAEAITELMGRVFGHDIADLPAISDTQLAAMGAHDVTTRLGELSGIPTLVISSEFDLIAPPSSGRAIAAGIPGARYVEIENASHAFPILQAERCAALIEEHLAAAERKGQFAKT
jgi:pimeloyl-ACP methyl ester carboxylesterase